MVIPLQLIIFGFFILLYHISEGATEGYIWMKPAARRENPIITPNSYHTWRLLENIGIAGMVLTVLVFVFVIIMKVEELENINDSAILYILLKSTLSRLIEQLIYFGIGMWFIGYFAYERVLMYVSTGKFFKERGHIYHLLGIDIPRYPWQDFTLLGIGGLILTWLAFQ